MSRSLNHSYLIKIAFLPKTLLTQGLATGAIGGAITNMFLPKKKKNFLRSVGIGALAGAGLSHIPGVSKTLEKLYKQKVLSPETIAQLSKKSPQFKKEMENQMLHFKRNAKIKELKTLRPEGYKKEISQIRKAKLSKWTKELKDDVTHPIQSLKRQNVMTDYNINDKGQIYKGSPIGRVISKGMFFGVPAMGAVTSFKDDKASSAGQVASLLTPKIIPSMLLYDMPGWFKKKKKLPPTPMPRDYHELYTQAQ